MSSITNNLQDSPARQKETHEQSISFLDRHSPNSGDKAMHVLAYMTPLHPHHSSLKVICESGIAENMLALVTELESELFFTQTQRR